MSSPTPVYSSRAVLANCVENTTEEPCFDAAISLLHAWCTRQGFARCLNTRHPAPNLLRFKPGDGCPSQLAPDWLRLDSFFLAYLIDLLKANDDLGKFAAYAALGLGIVLVNVLSLVILKRQVHKGTTIWT